MAEYEHYRKIVEQKLLFILDKGAWEGSHLDLKLKLENKDSSIAKLLKHILAFSNTPRKDDAFIFFGINEDKAKKTISHEGTTEFPSVEKIYSIVTEHTNLTSRDIVIDDQFQYNDKRTPYIVIRQVFRGPNFLIKNLKSKPKTVAEDKIYVRYGRSSEEVSERDRKRMDDWAEWAIDCRFAANKDELTSIIKKYFQPTIIEPKDKYIRFIYIQDREDDLGPFRKHVLVHAYEGIGLVNKDAFEYINNDKFDNADKYIIGPNFTLDLIKLTDEKGIRCIKLEDIFFKDDPYANYCKSFLKLWDEEAEEAGITRVIDLDYIQDGQRLPSVVSYLDSCLRKEKKHTTVVTGDFGTGKSITAKYITAELVKDYLRKVSDRLKVIFIDLHDYDIRARTEEIIQAELGIHCGMKPEHINQLVKLYEKNKIHLIFDSVDEMGRPYTVQGRKQAVDTLKTIGNQASDIYFVRSTYFKSKNELLNFFQRLAPDSLEVAEICDLSEDQLSELLQNRLQNEDTLEKVKRFFKSSDFKDPLIVGLIIRYLQGISEISEEDGTGSEKIADFFHSSPVSGRINFLNYLLDQLISREKKKRRRHYVSQHFDIFVDCLSEIAFHMICDNTNSYPIKRWDEIINTRLDRINLRDFKDEAADSFRTMAWVHRSDRTEEVTFRNELLSLLCAARFVISAITDFSVDIHKQLTLQKWNQESGMANIVQEYTACLLEGTDIISMALALEENTNGNIRQLLLGVFNNISTDRGFKAKNLNIDDSAQLGKLGNCIAEYPITAKPIMPLIYNNPKKYRFAQLIFPLLVKLNHKYSNTKSKDVSNAAKMIIDCMYDITRNWKETSRGYHLGNHIKHIKEHSTTYFDDLLLNEMGVTKKSITAAGSYLEIFERFSSSKNIFTIELDKKYVEKSLNWIKQNVKEPRYK